MRVLIDECLPRVLKTLLIGHTCSTVQEVGWSGRKNGSLLKLADSTFDVLLTIDDGLQYQQSLFGLSISVVIIEASSNKVEDVAPVVPAILDALSRLRPAQFVRVSAS
jgi:hypothetical protein